MKKIFSLFVALTAVFSMSAKTLYLQPNNDWKSNNARFAVYAFVDDSNNQWYDLAAVAEEDGIFSAVVDDKYTKVIFCRMNPAITENRWNKAEDRDNKPVWNQTQDMTIEAEKDQCNITDWNAGVWAKHGEVPVVKYYLKNNWKGEKEWSWKEMTAREDGKYELLKVVFGGTGVNLNVAETDDGSKFFSSEEKAEGLKIQGDKIQALDTVNFVLELKTEEAIVTAELVGRPKAPEYRLENGYYLMGSMLDWKLENVNAAQKFIANADNDGEWVLKEVKLEVGDSIKVIEVAADTIKAWFGTEGGDKNYGIDEKHAGEKKDIYFNPTKQDKWNGYIWIGENVEPVEEKEIKLVPYLWANDGAQIAAWVWNKDKSVETFTAFFKPINDGSDTLAAKVNVKADSIIFVRFSDKATEPKWNGGDGYQWNQTPNDSIQWESSVFTIIGCSGYNCNGTWERYIPEPPAKYYIVGDSAIVGSKEKEWQPDGLKAMSDTTVLNLQPGKFSMRLTLEGTWEGPQRDFRHLTDTAKGLVEYIDDYSNHNITFELKEAGEVKVIFIAASAAGQPEVFKLIGNFFVPEPGPDPELPNVALIGTMNGWDGGKNPLVVAEDKKSASAKVELALNNDKGYEFKILVGSIGLSAKSADDQDYALHRGWSSVKLDWVDENSKPIWLSMDIAGEYTFTFNFEDSVLTVTFPEKPEPLADGYYLVGTFNDWTASAEVKLALNEAVAAQGVEEYAINIELAEGDSLKVVKIAGEESTWFPKDKNVGIDADHAGKKDVYFRPAGNDEWKEFNESGFFWIDANEPSAVENTEANVKAVKTLRNGMLIIEKNGVRYNVLGTVIR